MELPGGFRITGASPQQEKFLKARGVFVQKYVAEKGWDINNMSIQQVLEIRQHEGWKHPICPTCGSADRNIIKIACLKLPHPHEDPWHKVSELSEEKRGRDS